MDTGLTIDRPTETVVPLDTVTEPQGPTGITADGQLVTVPAGFVDGDWLVVGDRYNGGEPGYWVVGHAVTPEGVGLVAAVGWTPEETTARTVAERLNSTPAPDTADVELEGRYFASEGPQDSDYQAGELTTVAPSAFINLWRDADPGGVYGGYLVAANAADALSPGSLASLEAIDSHPPPSEVELNWLNIFYAVEWVIFAGFAIYLWWRLVRDEWEKENAAAPGPTAPSVN